MFKQSNVIRSTAIKLTLALAMLWVFPALGQEPADDYGPGATGGIDTHFTVTLDENTNFTITAGDSISAIIRAFSTQSLDINLSGWSGVESTLITVSGLPANVPLYKSDNDLRNRVVITTDAQGTCSWMQDVTESHNILIKPNLSTFYLGEDGWEGNPGPGTWDSASKTMTLTANSDEIIQIQGSGITLDGAGYGISSGESYYIYLNRCTDVTVRNIVISEPPSATGTGIYDNGGRSNLIENNEIDGLTNAIFCL